MLEVRAIQYDIFSAFVMITQASIKHTTKYFTYSCWILFGKIGGSFDTVAQNVIKSFDEPEFEPETRKKL